MDAREKKNLVRKELLAVRKAIPAEQRQLRSEEACERLSILAADVFAGHGVVGVYFAIGSEVQLDSFIRAAYDAECTVAFPFMVQSDNPAGDLRMLSVPQIAYLEHGAELLGSVQKLYGEDDLCALEKQGLLAETLAPVSFQVVPLVGFSPSGTRMGYGKGCYDRYFASLQDLPQLVGVAFGEQERADLPAEAHDVVLSEIVIA